MLIFANKMRINTNIKDDDKRKLIFPELSYRIMGILFNVHNELGSKYQEKYYQRAIEIELRNNNIKYQIEVPVNLYYKTELIGKYFLDFLIDDKIILEIKAKGQLSLTDFKQISGYLKAKNLKLGIIVNFRQEQLLYKRILNPDIS